MQSEGDQLADADPGLSRAEEEDSLVGQPPPCQAKAGQDPCQADAGCALYVVVEAALQAAILVEQPERVVVTKVLEL